MSMSLHIESLEITISSMKKEIEDLRKENMAFRKSISNAILSLKNSNDESREMIVGKTGGGITNDSSFKPKFKIIKSKDKI